MYVENAITRREFKHFEPACFGAGVLRRNSDTHLSRNRTAGRFSIIGDEPLTIEAKPGMVLFVYSGHIHSRWQDNTASLETPVGGRFVAGRSGTLEVRARAGTELQVKWPH